jgi:hypothetical protein
LQSIGGVIADRFLFDLFSISLIHLSLLSAFALSALHHVVAGSLPSIDVKNFDEYADRTRTFPKERDPLS